MPAGQIGVMQYDAAGNLTNDTYQGGQGGGGTRTYDAEGRMTQARFVNGQLQAASYAYDADGRRVKRNAGAAGDRFRVAVEGGAVKYYRVAGGALTLLRASAAGPRYPLVADTALYGAGDRLDDVVVGGGGGAAAHVRWLVSDQLGTPRMAVDESGGLGGIKRHDYLPFGEEIGPGVGGRTPSQGYSQLDRLRQKFTNYERDDETGLDYAVARYYANTQGRFTSVDPLMSSGVPLAPQSWNRYAYTYNNPLTLTDPTGMFVIDPNLSPDDRKKILDGYAQLQKALTKHKKGSEDYNRINRALETLGKPNVDNGISVTIGQTADPDAGAETTPVRIEEPTPTNPTQRRISITFNEDTFGDSSAAKVAGELGHEAIHADDYTKLLQSGHAKDIHEAFEKIRYTSEFEGFSVTGAVTQVLTPKTQWGYPIGPTGAQQSVYLWNPAWAKVDAAKITRLRGEDIKKLLTAPEKEGGYGLSQPTKPKR